MLLRSCNVLRCLSINELVDYVASSHIIASPAAACDCCVVTAVAPLALLLAVGIITDLSWLFRQTAPVRRCHDFERQQLCLCGG
jgi:hypothetical protein